MLRATDVQIVSQSRYRVNMRLVGECLVTGERRFLYANLENDPDTIDVWTASEAWYLAQQARWPDNYVPEGQGEVINGT